MVRRRKTLAVCFTETKHENTGHTHQILKETNGSVVNFSLRRKLFFPSIPVHVSGWVQKKKEIGAIVDGAKMTAPVSSKLRREFDAINP